MSVSEQALALDSAPELDQEDERRQFVTFFVGDQCMAFDMGRVMEIVRVPQTVDVPLTPSSLIGLANLRGTILPVLSLRRVLGQPDVDHTDATRVMVLNYFGRPLGFVVDKVTRVIGVQPEAIETIDARNSTFDSRLLAGVLKNIDDQPLIQLMNIDALTEQEYRQFTAANERKLVAGLEQAGTLAKHEGDDSDDENILQLVSFSVADQEYSFDIAATKEIIRLPENINSVPQAPSHVIGMVNLRDHVLPLVKLRTMFNLEEAPLSEMNRIVVLTLRKGNQVSMVGVVVDEVREVLRIRRDQVEEVPALLLEGQDMEELEGICQLNNGDRIVTLLSADKLFHRHEILDAVKSVEGSQVDLTDDELHDENDTMNENNALIDDEDNEPQLVVFNLKDQEYGVMIEAVKEILRLPESLTQVPQTSEYVEGMINLRGTVLPIIDMRARFGLERNERNDRQRIVVLNRNNVLTGYIVDSVSEVLRLQESQIEPAPNLSAEQAQIMGRIVNLRDKKRMITVLEPQELLSNDEQSQLIDDLHESSDR